MNGDLGPVTGFAGDGFEFHRTVGDLADFDFKKAADEIRMTAGEDDFGAAGGIVHRHDIGAQTVADAVFLGHDPFAGGHCSLEFSEINDDVRFLETPHGSTHNFPGAIFELLIDHVLLDLADALVDGLPGGLGGDTAEIPRGDLDLQFVPRLDIGLEGAGLRENDLVVGIGHLLGGNQLRHGANRPGFRIDLNAQLAGTGGKVFLRSR